MKREELDVNKLVYATDIDTVLVDCEGTEVWPQDNNGCEYYYKSQADKVMDDLEANINNLEKANAELIKRVIELEEENNKLEDENQRLFDEAYELNGKVLELESALRISEEMKTKWFLKSMGLNALRNRIKELEAEVEMDAKKRRIMIDGYNKKCERVKELEAQCTKYQAELMNSDPALNDMPKWILVKDRLPNEKEQYELLWIGYVRTDGTIKYVYEASFDYSAKEFYTENDWGDKTFVNPDIWMVVPPPPTTEDSSDVEKEK